MVQQHNLPDINLAASGWTIEKNMESAKIKVDPVFLKLNTSIPKKYVKKYLINLPLSLSKFNLWKPNATDSGNYSSISTHRRTGRRGAGGKLPPQFSQEY